MKTKNQLRRKQICLSLMLSAIVFLFVGQAWAQWSGPGRVGGFGGQQSGSQQFRQSQPSSLGSSSRGAWSQGQSGTIKQMDTGSFSSGQSKQRFQGEKQTWGSESGSQRKYKNIEGMSGFSDQGRPKFNVGGQGTVSKQGQKSNTSWEGSKASSTSKVRDPKTPQSIGQFGSKSSSGKSVEKTGASTGDFGKVLGSTRPGTLHKSSGGSTPGTGQASTGSSVLKGSGKIQSSSSSASLGKTGSGKSDFGKLQGSAQPGKSYKSSEGSVPGTGQASNNSSVLKGFGKIQPGTTDAKTGKPGIAKGDFGSAPIASTGPSSPDWKKTMLETAIPDKHTGVGGHIDPLKSSVVKGAGKIQQSSQGGDTKGSKLVVDSIRNFGTNQKMLQSSKGSAPLGGVKSGAKEIVTSKKVDSQNGKTTSIQTKEVLDKTTGNKKVLAQKTLEYSKDPKTGNEQVTGAEITKSLKDKNGNIVQEKTYIRRDPETQDVTKTKILTDKSGKVTESTEIKSHRDPKTGKIKETETVKDAAGKVIGNAEKVVEKNPATGGQTITKTETKLDPKTQKVATATAKIEKDAKGNVKSTSVGSDSKNLEKGKNFRLFDDGTGNPTPETAKELEKHGVTPQDMKEASIKTLVLKDGTIQQIATLKDGTVIQGAFDSQGKLLSLPTEASALMKIDASQAFNRDPLTGVAAPGGLADIFNQLGQGPVTPESILQTAGQVMQSLGGQGMGGASDPSQMGSMSPGGASPGSMDFSCGGDDSGWESAQSETEYLPDDSNVVMEDDEPHYSQAPRERPPAASRSAAAPRVAEVTDGNTEKQGSARTLQVQDDPQCGRKLEEAVNEAVGRGIQEYGIQDIIEAADIDRARELLPRYSAWKYGGMAQACMIPQDAKDLAG